VYTRSTCDAGIFTFERTTTHFLRTGREAALELSSNNRLAEFNMHGIARDIERFYNSNSRNDVNQTLADLLLGSLVHETPVMNTDIRRQIYCILMSAEDFSDAAEKLVKCGTKNQTVVFVITCRRQSLTRTITCGAESGSSGT